MEVIMSIRVYVCGNIGTPKLLVMRFIAGSLRRIGVEVKFSNSLYQSLDDAEKTDMYPYEESTGIKAREGLRAVGKPFTIVEGILLDLTDVPSTYWKEPEGSSGRGYIHYDLLEKAMINQGVVIIDDNKYRYPKPDPKPDPDEEVKSLSPDQLT